MTYKKTIPLIITLKISCQTLFKKGVARHRSIIDLWNNSLKQFDFISNFDDYLFYTHFDNIIVQNHNISSQFLTFFGNPFLLACNTIIKANTTNKTRAQGSV